MNDIELLHYAVNKGLAEHKFLKKYNEELRSLALASIMAHADEDVAEGFMRQLTALNLKYKDSANATSGESDT